MSDKLLVKENNGVLSDYIRNWMSIEGVKPCNEDVFVNGFITFMNTLSDERDITFDGDGAYFGKQVTISYNSAVCVGDQILCFEIAFSKNGVSIYTGRHEGFWTTEYVNADSSNPIFDKVMRSLVPLLSRASGLSELFCYLGEG